MVVAGLLAGAAPLVDYQAVFAVVPVGGLRRRRAARARRPAPRSRARSALAAAGAAVPIGVLLAYHAVCFGSPWRTGYDASTRLAYHHQHGFLGMDTLRWEAFVGSLFTADNGLVTLAPWLLLAIPGGVLLARRGDRGTALVGAAVAVDLHAVHLVDQLLARRLGGRPALHHGDAAVPAAARRGGGSSAPAAPPARAGWSPAPVR